MLFIDDELTAFAFDSAAAIALIEWENKRDLLRLEAQKNAMRQAISEAFGGEVAPPLSFDDENRFDDDDDPDVI